MFVLLLLALPATVVLVYVLWTFLVLYVRQARSPLRNLPGPPSPSFFLGHLRELHDQENTGLLARWEAEHGSTLIYRGFIGGQRLLTTDARAVAHILGHPDDFPKPDFVRATLASMAAGHEGLIVVEGEDHRRQVRVPLCSHFGEMLIGVIAQDSGELIYDSQIRVGASTVYKSIMRPILLVLVD